MTVILLERLQAALNQIQTKSSGALLQLNAPASEAQLSGLASTLGLSLPDVLQQVYRTHNGQAPESDCVFNREVWLSVEQIAAVWHTFGQSSPYQSHNEGLAIDDEVQALWWHPAWIPFSDDGRGNHLCVDMAPTADGETGQIIRVCAEDMTRSLEASSLWEWFEQHVDSLEQSDYVYSAKHGGIVDAEILFAEEDDAQAFVPASMAQWDNMTEDLQHTLNGLLGEGAVDLKSLVKSLADESVAETHTPAVKAQHWGSFKDLFDDTKPAMVTEAAIKQPLLNPNSELDAHKV